MIDLATLTGAARVALGAQLPALFCRHMDLARELVDRGLALHDPLWHLPLWRDYHAGIESDIADIVNTGRRAAGRRHQRGAVPRGLRARDLDWLHIDLFAWNDSARPGRPVGGEAQTLRTLLAYLEQRFAPPGLWRRRGARLPAAACGHRRGSGLRRRRLMAPLGRHLLEFADRSVEECRQPGPRCASGLAEDDSR